MTAPAQPLSRGERAAAGRAARPASSGRTTSAVRGASSGRARSSASSAPARSSAATAPVLEPAPRRVPGRVRLTVVRPAPPGARKGPFVVLLLMLLGAGLLGLLLLNLALMEGSFQETKLRNQAASLADAQQSLAVQADQLSDPAALAAAATRAGMVPGGVPQSLAAGSPLPPGARVLSREPDSGAVLVIVPAPAGQQAAATGPAPAAAQAPAGTQPATTPASSAGPADGATSTGTGSTGTGSTGTGSTGTGSTGEAAGTGAGAGQGEPGR